MKGQKRSLEGLEEGVEVFKGTRTLEYTGGQRKGWEGQEDLSSRQTSRLPGPRERAHHGVREGPQFPTTQKPRGASSFFSPFSQSRPPPSSGLSLPQGRKD